jgi:hypothetical protein
MVGPAAPLNIYLSSKNRFDVHVNRVNIPAMKTKNAVKTSSPVLELEITKDHYGRAIRAASGGCLFAEDITTKYPQLSNVDVDVATIRATDRAAGVRYIYLTPRGVGDFLLHFDQGWAEDEKSLPRKFIIRKAVRILPIIRNPADIKAKAERRKIRLAELEAKEQSGEELTREEKGSLVKFRAYKEPVKRPATFGPATAEGEGNNIVIRGGAPLKRPKNPNLLAGRNRIFGAKTARPAEVFEQAVQQAMKERLEEMTAAKEQELALTEVEAP